MLCSGEYIHGKPRAKIPEGGGRPEMGVEVGLGGKAGGEGEGEKVGSAPRPGFTHPGPRCTHTQVPDAPRPAKGLPSRPARGCLRTRRNDSDPAPELLANRVLRPKPEVSEVSAPNTNKPIIIRVVYMYERAD